MDMTGERRIAAPREAVWLALNDPAVLKASIPGCESLEKTSETEMKASASMRIGPIAARFAGKVQLSDIDPPNGYTISGEGQGGVAGFAKGGAEVHLSEDGGETILRYSVKAQVGGKIAQLGARLIDATAKQMADAFFDRFSASLAPPAVEAVAGAEPDATISGAPSPGAPSAAQAPMPSISLIPAAPFGLPRIAWVGIALFLLILALIGKSLLP